MPTAAQKFMVFDQDSFLSICNGDHELENNLLNVISHSLIKETYKLEMAGNQRETEGLRQQWHHLKGTLGGLGQLHLCKIIDQLEASDHAFSPSNLLLHSSFVNKLKILALEMEKFSKMKQKISN